MESRKAIYLGVVITIVIILALVYFSRKGPPPPPPPVAPAKSGVPLDSISYDWATGPSKGKNLVFTVVPQAVPFSPNLMGVGSKVVAKITGISEPDPAKKKALLGMFAAYAGVITAVDSTGANVTVSPVPQNMDSLGPTADGITWGFLYPQ